QGRTTLQESVRTSEDHGPRADGRLHPQHRVDVAVRRWQGTEEMPPGTAPASKREIKWGVEVSCMSPAKSIVPVTWNLKGGQVCYTRPLQRCLAETSQLQSEKEPQALCSSTATATLTMLGLMSTGRR